MVSEKPLMLSAMGASSLTGGYSTGHTGGWIKLNQKRVVSRVSQAGE